MSQKFIGWLAFLFLLLPAVVSAQQVAIETAASKIDELIYYDSLDEALLQVEAGLENISSKPKNSKEAKHKIKLELHKAYILARKNQISQALQLALEINDQAKRYQLPEYEYRSNLFIETMYEHSSDFKLCRKYLDLAQEVYLNYNLDSIYSVYCVRIASYFRLTNQIDSALMYAQKAKVLATQYNNQREKTDANLLIGMLLPFEQYKEAIKYYQLAFDDYKNRKNNDGATAMLMNIAAIYLKHNDYANALLYCDSGMLQNGIKQNYFHSNIQKLRFRVYDSLNNADSALHYFKKYHESYVSSQADETELKVKKVTAQYENGKNKAVIQNKNQLLVFLGITLLLVLSLVLLLFFSNKKIKAQNNIISSQMQDLNNVLENKQVLLSELQHRVKNNLQHVISIMEIQKESMNHNNIEEQVRETQNRVLSMALIHKKLNIAEDVNEVNLLTYLNDLADSVVNSYKTVFDNVHLKINSNLNKVTIDKALPIGMILVELISNSIKHAFKNINEGIINIAIIEDADTNLKTLHYTDNGKGYDFNRTDSNGLGLQIIKGLIDQLDAIICTNNNHGFGLSIKFN